MAEVILRTKLFAPRLRPEFVDRPHLVDRLQAGEGGKLTLICGPAGFGKTTLAASWLARTDRPSAWLSLDERDNDLVGFFIYVVAAVQQIDGVGRAAQTLLDSSPSAPLTALATALINDCTTAAEPFILVLDDYHVIGDTEIHDAVTFLIDNLPPQVHLAIASRTEPVLPLPRLRADGQITEVRAADLRFDPVESATFLEQMAGHRLAEDQLIALDRRVEGWPAGLQMAAISIRDIDEKSEIAELVDDFAASRRYIFDYLVDEVLIQRPSEVQAFLLRTSLLERLNPSLCDATTDRSDSAEVLRDLEDRNIFLFPLDTDHSWFRYHHLFAELLRRRLRQADPDLVEEIHLRASRWFEDNGYPDDAIHHALEGRHHDRAARLCRVFGTRWLGQSNIHKAKRWLEMLPVDQIERRPRLGILYAWALVLTNELAKAEECLRNAERRLDEAESRPQMIDEWALPDPAADLRRMEGEIATCRAVLARANGDVSGIHDHVKRALSLLADDAVAQRGTALLYLGFAEWMAGNGESALAAFDAAVEAAQAARRPYTAVSATTAGGRLHMERGELGEAAASFQTAFRLAERHTEETGVVLPIVAEAHTGLAKLAYERDDMASAWAHLEQALLRLEPLGVTEDWVDACLLQARLLWVANDRPASRDHMRAVASAVEKAEMAPILQGRIRTQELDFRVRERADGHDEHTNTVDGNPRTDGNHSTTITNLQEEELPVVARWKIVTGAIDDALDLLGRLDDVTRSGGRVDRLIKVLLLKSMALRTRTDVDTALTPLNEALALGAPAGYLRTFLNESEWLRELLPVVSRSPYRDRLLARMERATIETGRHPRPAGDRATIRRADLSDRELDVLRLLATHLSGPEIATELYVSTNTLKSHTRSIYRKLGVGKRSEAVSKARATGLI